MAWKFDNNIPIYIQISNTLKLQIVTNQLKSGDKLPTVRDLAETAGVNPNTVQRALSLGFKQDELVKQLDDFLKGVSYE